MEAGDGAEAGMGRGGRVAPWRSCRGRRGKAAHGAGVSHAASAARVAASTQALLVEDDPHGASSNPARTCPPRAAAAPIGGRMSTPGSATIHGAPGVASASKARWASK